MYFSRRGLALLEAIISIALISILVLSVTLVSLVILRSWQGELGYSKQRLAAANGVEIIIKELRGALEISNAQEHEVSFWLDFNNNGIKNNPGEQVTYSWSGISGEGLTRLEGASLNQEILKNLNNFSITYLGQNNQVLALPISNLASIRVLRINLNSNLEDESIDLLFSAKVRNL